MNGKDKISVIIPCYNVQKYIMRCFDSIYSQTYGFENLEVILIDDLSTDNTWSILESLQRKYPENVISLKIQKKGKCGGARNLGMDICTGKYITFVDADDYVHPDMLMNLIADSRAFEVYRTTGVLPVFKNIYNSFLIPFARIARHFLCVFFSDTFIICRWNKYIFLF